MTMVRGMVLTLALSVAGAALGAWGGSQYVMHRMQRPTALHELVHEKLDLTPQQHAQIERMERDHAVRRQALATEMKSANSDLAQAFQAQHSYTPQVQAAIDRFHQAMGAQQKETMVHVLAMRAVLTPAQAARFDETVVKSLTAEPM